MKIRPIKTKKFYLSVIIIIATSGSIFFFPMNIGGKYTCFYHRIFDHSQPVSDVIALDHHQDGKKNLSKSGDNNMNRGTVKKNYTDTSHDGSVLLDNYLHQYAFSWWTSVGLLAICIYLLLKLKKNVKITKSGFQVK